ncbi:hypothetical protein GALMADRAFT_755106 [Galerina marginata CBS 339.88]|uniref:Uncharacterized protein n=1 Tax=Galerina marginata (strain CBS 339.88) TaxID=685588 RepID=A0A067T0P5_GALM3|nr:hypothetical protein GALMADRAFT_755106 [Galerina marginata CBS 339.88]
MRTDFRFPNPGIPWKPQATPRNNQLVVCFTQAYLSGCTNNMTFDKSGHGRLFVGFVEKTKL